MTKSSEVYLGVGIVVLFFIIGMILGMSIGVWVLTYLVIGLALSVLITLLAGVSIKAFDKFDWLTLGFVWLAWPWMLAEGLNFIIDFVKTRN